MNGEEVAKLCVIVGRVCPTQQMVPADPPREPGTVAEWYILLSDVRYADASEAVYRLARRQRFIAPSEIIDEVRTIRAERLDALPQNQRPTPNVDPMDTRRYVIGVRAIERAIADGDIRTDGNGGFILPDERWHAAITAGPVGEKREVDYSWVVSDARLAARAEQRAVKQRLAEREQRAAEHEREERERVRQLAALAEMQEAYARARAAKLGRKRRMWKLAAKSLSVPAEERIMGEEPQAVRDAAAWQASRSRAPRHEETSR